MRTENLKKIISLGLAMALSLSIPLNINAEQESNEPPQLASETAVLIDADSGQVLFEKDMNEKMYPASITKIMTAILALEKGKLDDVITMSYDAVFSIPRDTSHIALDKDEQITLENAMYAMAMESANDASNGIAEYIGGSQAEFAQMMTQRAKEIGAVNTNFTNAHGLPDDDHYTTAYDMALITREAIKQSDFVKIFGCLLYEMPPTNRQPKERTFRSRHYMLYDSYKYDGAIAGKNGWTEEAKHTLVTVAQRNGRTLIAVVLKSSGKDDKFDDTTKLFDYGFDSFREVTIEKSQVMKSDIKYPLEDGNEARAEFYADSNITFLLNIDIPEDAVAINYNLPEQLSDNKQAQAEITVNEEYSSLMYRNIGKFPLRVTKTVTSAVKDEPKKNNLLLNIFLWVVWVVAFLATALFITRFFIKRHYRKKRIKRARAKNRWKI